MRKSRSSEAQIIGVIKEQEAGMPTAEVCRKHGLSQSAFYKFNSKYGGMEVSDAAKLCAGTDENAKLKRYLQCGNTTSRSVGPAGLSVLARGPSDVSARRTIQRYALR